MATVQDIYDEVCDDLCEPGGLVLGVLSEAAFLNLLNLTLLDYLKETGLIQRVFTQTIFAGEPLYDVPDTIMRVDVAFVAGRYIGQESVTTLTANNRDWRRQQGFPLSWHQDGLPPKKMRLALTPIYNGSYIIGPDEPAPPHAVYDAFSAEVSLPSSVNPVLQAPRQHRGLSVVGPEQPDLVDSLGDPIPLLPDEFALGYLAFGVLERIFSGDNELRDSQRALYCHAQYQEGVALGKAITGEVGE